VKGRHRWRASTPSCPCAAATALMTATTTCEPVAVRACDPRLHAHNTAQMHLHAVLPRCARRVTGGCAQPMPFTRTFLACCLTPSRPPCLRTQHVPGRCQRQRRLQWPVPHPCRERLVHCECSALGLVYALCTLRCLSSARTVALD